jgi:hypothetical protein
MKRINVLALRIIPEMIFDQYLHSDLSVWHGSIINEQTLTSAKAKLECPTNFSLSMFAG